MLTVRNREKVSNVEKLINEIFENREEKCQRSYFTPNINIKENRDIVIIEAELAGIDKKDIKVTYENSKLKISGEKKYKNDKKQNYSHRAEIKHGNFKRVIHLNEEYIQVDSISADYNNGILTINIDKTEEKKPKEIEISVS